MLTAFVGAEKLMFGETILREERGVIVFLVTSANLAPAKHEHSAPRFLVDF